MSNLKNVFLSLTEIVCFLCQDPITTATAADQPMLPQLASLHHL